MGPGDQLGAHQGVLAVKGSGVYLFQGIPAQIVIAVAGCARKVALGHTVVRKGAHDPELVGLGRLLQTGKHVAQGRFRLRGKLQYLL